MAERHLRSVPDIVGRGGGDDSQNPPYDGGMSAAPTREEFQRTIEASEARMDARVARLEGKIDAFMAAQEVRDAERDKRLDLMLSTAVKAEERSANTKGVVVTTAVASTLTILIAIIGTYFAAQQSSIGIAQLVAQVYQQGQQSAQPPAPQPRR